MKNSKAEEMKIIKIESLEQLGDIFDKIEAEAEREEAHSEAPEQLPTEEDINAWAMMLYKMKNQ